MEEVNLHSSIEVGLVGFIGLDCVVGVVGIVVDGVACVGGGVCCLLVGIATLIIFSVCDDVFVVAAVTLTGRVVLLFVINGP